MTIRYQYQGHVEPLSQQGENVTLDKWNVQPSEPVRPGIFNTAVFASSLFFVSLAAVPEPTVDMWVQPTSAPVRTAPDINRGSFTTDPLSLTQPESISIDKWFRPASEPVRTPPDINRGDIFTDSGSMLQGEAVSMDRWFQPASEPVRTPPRALDTPFAFLTEFSIPGVETVTLDKWFQPASEPFKAPLEDPNRGAISIDPGVLLQGEAVSVDKWFRETSQPIFEAIPPVNAPALTLVETIAAEAVVPLDRWFVQYHNPPLPAPNIDWLGLYAIDPLQLLQGPTVSMDKWFQPASEPVRTPPTALNTTFFNLIEFNVPPPPADVTMDTWFPGIFQPIFDRVHQEYITNDNVRVEATDVFADFAYTGTLSFSLTPTSTYAATFAYDGTLSFTLVHTSDYDGKFNYDGTVSVVIKAPDTGVVSFTDKPGTILAVVYVDGVNETNNIQGVVNVIREDNAAARFSFLIGTISKKPAEFINKVVTVQFQAADMTGLVSDYIPIFTGLCKQITWDDDVKAYELAGYDYGGVHGSPGEFVSQAVMPVLTGSVYINAAGTFSTGFSPIWAVTYTGTADVEDGRDYFTDTLNGEIIIPLSSNLIANPAGLTFTYANPFASLKALIENIAATKGWTLSEDGVTIVDYTTVSKQPVLSLSNESVIDIVRKFLELTGAKLETNLFPEIRVYSHTANLIGSDDHVIDETICYENSVVFDIDLSQLITQQTVRSVAKTYAEISIGASETFVNAVETASSEVHTDQFFFPALDSAAQVAAVLDMFTNLGPKVLGTVRVSKDNIASLSSVAGGTFNRVVFDSPTLPPTYAIQDSDWTQTIDQNDIVYTLSVMPEIIELTARIIISYPGADWTLDVSGTKILYGEGTVEDTVSVTGTRAVTGIADSLVGDVYENPYIETAAHAGNIANAILTTAGNVYTLVCEIPLHLAATMNIGDKISYNRTGAVRVFDGIIMALDYSIDTETGESPVQITARGVGINI